MLDCLKTAHRAILAAPLTGSHERIVCESPKSQKFFILTAAVVKTFAQRPIHGLVGAHKTRGQCAGQSVEQEGFSRNRTVV